MTRLIDAASLLQGYEDHDFIDTHIIWNTPTIDAVPVIRCKDCKYNPENAMSYLDDDLIEGYIHCGHLGDEGFCSLGKRKEE